MNRRLVLPVLAVAALAIAVAPATAKPKKPISKTYTATAPAPDPTNWLSDAGVPTYSVCAQNVPNSYHTEVFKATASGAIKIEVSGFQGD